MAAAPALSAVRSFHEELQHDVGEYAHHYVSRRRHLVLAVDIVFVFHGHFLLKVVVNTRR